MESIIDHFFHRGSRPQIGCSEEYQDQIRFDLTILNLKRERILSVVLIFFLTIIISFILIYRNTVEITHYISTDSLSIHFTLIAFAVLFLILTSNLRKSASNKKKLNILHNAILSVVMIFSALIAINNEQMNQRPFTYIIAIYAMASFLILDKTERRVIFWAPYLIYLVGISIALHDVFVVLHGFIFTFPLMILAVMISCINYTSYIRNFLNSKTIEKLLEQRTDQLNHAMELEKVRSAFFSNVSHELRTPLNLIYSAEQMQRMIYGEENIQNKKKELIRYNGIIQKNCYRLIRMIENMIDITEVDAGQHRMSLKRHDIVKLVGEVAWATSKHIEERNIQLHFHSDMENKVIACDAEKIERILLNLLSNAVKFTPAGGRIQVGIAETENSILLNVKDTGIGIPLEMKESVFDKFVKVDKSISRLREGSGIGLAIVKAFVTLHKGNIEIISQEGQGSNFIIELPSDLIPCEIEGISVQRDYQCYEKVKMEFSDLYN